MSDTPRTDAAIDESVRGWSYQPLFDESRKIERELSDLRAKLAAAEKDAERYRWLRDRPSNNRVPHVTQWAATDLPHYRDVGMDTAIDAAIEKERGNG